MKRVLFLIHDLGVGGAEKVLVNLVNHMDSTRFDITVIALFGGGVNEQFLAPHIHYHAVWPRPVPGNSKLMKLLTPEQLHKLCVKEHYDIEVAYLEGPSARVISGCTDPNTRLFCWIHSQQHRATTAANSFRNYNESKACYRRFNQIVCVSKLVREDFLSIYPGVQNTVIYYNTLDTEKIKTSKNELITDMSFYPDELNLVTVGKICKSKGIDRLARIVKYLREDGLPVHLYALGVGPDQSETESYLQANRIKECFTFLGYQTNPYKYIARCDLFVCASLSEGFSTATTEALIIGTPVCTVEVSGMKEMLGENNEWGVVTENSEQALYEGIRQLLTDRKLLAYYKKQAEIRGKEFSTDKTVQAVEELLSGEQL